MEPHPGIYVRAVEMERRFIQGQRVFFVRNDFRIPCHAVADSGTVEYVCGDGALGIRCKDSFGEERTYIYEDANVYESIEGCYQERDRKNAEYARIAAMSDEEYNDFDFGRYLSRFFDHWTVQKVIESLHQFENYGDIEIKVSNSFTEDGKYRVYWKYFSPAVPGYQVKWEHGRETKAERERRNAAWAAGAKERFLREWKPLNAAGV